jgi:retron-type reverse transcriptase
MCQNTSDLLDIVKGCPQGSILGPILLNIFVNDLFLFVHKCELYNYADDNTLSKSDKSLEKVIASLEEDSKSLINWFSVNKMQANPEKFQAISLSKKTHDTNIIFIFRWNFHSL